MSVKSPNISALNSLFFAAGSLDPDNLEQQLAQIEEFEESSDRINETKLGCRPPSIYVEAFEGEYQVWNS
jgi:Fanconi-associated nuclease 1